MSSSRLSRALQCLRRQASAAEANSQASLREALPFNVVASQRRTYLTAGALLEKLNRTRPNGPDLSSFWQQRHINVDTHGQEGEELTEKDYHRLADLTLGEIMVKLESLIEDTPGIADSDLEYSQGVLTLNLGSHGTYVINKQGPNKQIWMSSPISGPVRYDLVNGKWIYKHDGHVFQERLAEELSDITGKDGVDLEQAPQVAKGYVGYGADPT